jgi:hypothetical protein
MHKKSPDQERKKERKKVMFDEEWKTMNGKDKQK